VPLDAMFCALMEQAAALRDVVLPLEQATLSRLLGSIVRAAVDGVDAEPSLRATATPLRRARSGSDVAVDAESAEWTPVMQPPMCQVHLESEHPYVGETDTYHTLSFPGAKYIKVR